METSTKSKLNKILVVAGCYLFLFAGFIAILYVYAHNVRLAFREDIDLLPVILKSLGYCVGYMIVNHILIMKVVGLKTVVIFESILILLLLILLLCNVYVEEYFARLNET